MEQGGTRSNETQVYSHFETKNSVQAHYENSSEPLNHKLYKNKCQHSISLFIINNFLFMLKYQRYLIILTPSTIS